MRSAPIKAGRWQVMLCWLVIYGNYLDCDINVVIGVLFFGFSRLCKSLC